MYQITIDPGFLTRVNLLGGGRYPMLCRSRMAAAFVMGIALPAVILASDLQPQSRMAIIRGLTAEYATLKIPLPRGKKGLSLTANGQVDQESLKREISQNGTAVQPNILVQITQVEFQDKEIVFEINGGGKRKSKWYDHVEVGIGNNTRPITQQATATPTGSSISLVFPQK